MNGRYAFALQIALPCELTHDQHMALAEDFVEATMHDKPLLLVKHEPVTDGQPQPHLHILVGARTEDGIVRGPEKHFRRYNAEHPHLGGAQKDRFWNTSQAPRQLRMAFGDLANYHLERSGVEARIDPRSLRKQGIERDRVSWEHPVRPDEATRHREQAQAAQAWEQRKAYKGLGAVQAIPREEFVLLVRQWTRDYDRGQQLPRVSLAEAHAWTTREQGRVVHEHAAVEQRLAQVERGMAGELRAHELLALTRPPVQEEAVTPGLRARIFEDEHPGYRY